MLGSPVKMVCCGDFHFIRILSWASLFLSVALHITIRQTQEAHKYNNSICNDFLVRNFDCTWNYFRKS